MLAVLCLLCCVMCCCAIVAPLLFWCVVPSLFLMQGVVPIGCCDFRGLCKTGCVIGAACLPVVVLRHLRFAGFVARVAFVSRLLLKKSRLFQNSLLRAFLLVHICHLVLQSLLSKYFVWGWGERTKCLGVHYLRDLFMLRSFLCALFWTVMRLVTSRCCHHTFEHDISF